MTDTPRYRYWGNQKPIAYAVLTDTAPASAKAATMRIYGPIDSWGAPFGVSADEFAQALDQVGDDVTEIDLHMHSVGGEVFEGLAIMNQLRQHPAKVNIVVDGLAASIASVIAMGADTVAMAPGAQMMIHDASGICIGTAQDMATMNTALESLSSNIADIYAARAGGSAEDWRAAMQPESWYKAQEAVDAGLADRVLTKDEAPDQPQASFDLSMFAHAGRDDAPAPVMPANRCRCGSHGTDVSNDARMEHKNECPSRTQTPAEPPVTPPTTNKEADTMSDTLSKGLRERLGVAEDATEDTILAALDEALAEQADGNQSTRTDDGKPDLKAAKAALEADGKVVVSQAFLDTLKQGAEAGQAALARQTREDRDKAIAQAQAEGKIGRSEDAVKAWQNAWTRDPENTAKEIAALGVRFPVGPTNGFTGHDTQKVEDGRVVDSSDSTVWSDEQADQLASLVGLPNGALR